MRLSKPVLSLAATLAVSAFPVLAFATPAGTSYILPISSTSGGSFTPVGGGYNGDPAYAHTGSAGDSSRIYWTVPANADPNPQLYSIQWWGAQGASGNGYQPFESQYDGSSETFPIDPNIPWAGSFGTNHQYISNGSPVEGQFNATGPGPHTPASTAYTAGDQGTSMWLKPGSEVYVKWDFGFYNNQTNVLSDIKLTQVTPEPGALSLLGLAGAGFLRRRRTV